MFYDGNGKQEEIFSVLYPDTILRTGYEDVPKDNPAWKIPEQLNAHLDELDNDIAAKLSAGNINAVNKVDTTDIAVIAAHVTENPLITQTKIADVNNDGKTDITDLAKLAAYIKGKTAL